MEPPLGVATVTTPGCFFAIATRSCMLRAGTLALTTTTMGVMARLLMAARSFTGS